MWKRDALAFVIALILGAGAYRVSATFGAFPYTEQPFTVCLQTDGELAAIGYEDRGATAFSDAYPFDGRVTVTRDDNANTVVLQATVILHSFTDFVYLPVITHENFHSHE